MNGNNAYISLGTDNSMIGFRYGRRLYQEITGYTGFYILTFDVVRRTNYPASDFTVLVNNEVKFNELIDNETVEQRTISWFNTDSTIRIKFASTD